jgi:hypothetical protein
VQFFFGAKKFPFYFPSNSQLDNRQHISNRLREPQTRKLEYKIAVGKKFLAFSSANAGL